MSGIQLSPDLVDGISALVKQHDQTADNDLIVMQYLTAITGFMLAHQSQPGLDKRSFLNELTTFMGQVVDQVEQDLRAQPPQEEAFGIWKPGQP